jgi:hypothetical protein
VFLGHTFSEPVAVFTLALVISTVGLWLATLKLAREARAAAAEQSGKMERSIDIANQEFVAAHGPMVRAMQFNIDVESWAGTGTPSVAEIFVYNDGRNDAVFVGERAFGSLRFWVAEHPPAGRPFGQSNNPFEMANPINFEKIDAGSGVYWTLTQFGMVTQLDVQEAIAGQSPRKLFVIGRLHYYDTRGAEMHTIFCREYDKKKKRFVLSDYPEYENREPKL